MMMSSGALGKNINVVLDDMSYHECTTLHADINECENGDDNCHENANCTNTEGGLNCSSNPGYSGDRVNCMSKLLYMYTHFCEESVLASVWLLISIPLT